MLEIVLLSRVDALNERFVDRIKFLSFEGLQHVEYLEQGKYLVPGVLTVDFSVKVFSEIKIACLTCQALVLIDHLFSLEEEEQRLLFCEHCPQHYFDQICVSKQILHIE